MAFRFTEAEMKFITEFYVQNFQLLYGRKKLNERVRAMTELTKTLCIRFRRQFTYKQIRMKLINMKADAKFIIETANGSPDYSKLSESESMLVRKILSTPIVDDSPACKKRKHPKRFSDDEGDDDDDDDGEDDEAIAAAQSIQGLRTMMPIRRTANGMRRIRRKVAGTSPQKRKPNSPSKNGSNALLKKSVLLLQQKLLEKQLERQQEEKSTATKFSLALDEFRRHVAEQRMVSRGVNVGDIPVDIPPGFQEGF